MRPSSEIMASLERQYAALDLPHVRSWKQEVPSRRAIGCMPVFAPREVLWAAGALPVCLRGAGDQIETIRGDSYYQSYICRLPRSTLELGLGGFLDGLDGMIFPNTCDVIRNLSGIWKDLFQGRFIRFLDPPQSTSPSAVTFWRHELASLYRDVCAMTGTKATDDALRQAMADYADAYQATRALSRARIATPWKVPVDEAYLLRRAADAIPPLAYAALVREYLEAVEKTKRRPEDRIRVVLCGAFCEQPPLGLLRALERAGAYVVDDDLLLSMEEAPVLPVDDPLEALACAYVKDGVPSSVHFDDKNRMGSELVARVTRAGADGVVLAAPSFCDPALLDQPRLAKALDAARIPYTTFKYAENTGQFQSIREQAGTFADSVKLRGHA